MMLYSEQMTNQMSVVDRARLYVSKCEPAISGENGHGKFFNVACKLVIGFGLSREEAIDVITNDYNARCEPPFSDYEIAHKIDDAIKQPGERGELAGSDVAPWERRNGTSHQAVAPAKPAPLSHPVGMLGELIGKLYRGEGDILYDAGDPFDGFECGPGKITILGAPPGAGKTALVMQYVFSLLENDSKARVVIANAEMTFEVLLRRELTRRSQVSGGKLRFRQRHTGRTEASGGGRRSHPAALRSHRDHGATVHNGSTLRAAHGRQESPAGNRLFAKVRWR